MKIIYVIMFFLLWFLQPYAQSGLLTLLGDDGVSYEDETLAYQTRVETDGGEIMNITALNNAIIAAKSGDYIDSLALWVSPSFGVKKDANNKVTVLYDVTSNDNDLIQADTSKCATLIGDSLNFNAENRFYEFTDIATIRATFWVLDDLSIGDTEIRFIMGDNSQYHFHRGALETGKTRIYWDAGFIAAGVSGGTLRENNNIVDGTGVAIKSIKTIISLITSANVEGGNFTQDRGNVNSAWNGRLWELVISSTPFSDTKRELIETNLNTRHIVY